MKIRFLLAVPVVAVLAGCASTATVNTTPANMPSGVSASVHTPVASSSPKVAKVGDTLNISGFDNENIAVTLVQAAKATGTDEFNRPESGKYLYAVQLRVTNNSSSVYSDSPDAGVTLLDAAGQQFQEHFADVTMGQAFSSVNVLPGKSALGVVVFEMPTGDSPVTLQFTPNAGFSKNTAQWSLI